MGWKKISRTDGVDTHSQPCRPCHSREKDKRSSMRERDREGKKKKEEEREKGENLLNYTLFSSPTHPFYTSTNTLCSFINFPTSSIVFVIEVVVPC